MILDRDEIAIERCRLRVDRPARLGPARHLLQELLAATPLPEGLPPWAHLHLRHLDLGLIDLDLPRAELLRRLGRLLQRRYAEADAIDHRDAPQAVAVWYAARGRVLGRLLLAVIHRRPLPWYAGAVSPTLADLPASPGADEWSALVADLASAAPPPAVARELLAACQAARPTTSPGVPPPPPAAVAVLHRLAGWPEAAIVPATPARQPEPPPARAAAPLGRAASREREELGSEATVMEEEAQILAQQVPVLPPAMPLGILGDATPPAPTGRTSTPPIRPSPSAPPDARPVTAPVASGPPRALAAQVPVTPDPLAGAGRVATDSATSSAGDAIGPPAVAATRATHGLGPAWGPYSPWAGLGFVIPACRQLGLDQAWAAARPEVQQLRWAATLGGIAQHLGVAGDDPWVAFLALVQEQARSQGAAGDAARRIPVPPTWLPTLSSPALAGGFTTALVERLHDHLRATAGMSLRCLCQRPGHLHWADRHLSLTFPLGHADLRLRVHGLDHDPGWLPGLGWVVRFHFLPWPDPPPLATESVP